MVPSTDAPMVLKEIDLAAMVKVYDAALDILRIGFDKEAITYMVTMLQHRYSMGYYDNPTLRRALLD